MKTVQTVLLLVAPDLAGTGLHMELCVCANPQLRRFSNLLRWIEAAASEEDGIRESTPSLSGSSPWIVW